MLMSRGYVRSGQVRFGYVDALGWVRLGNVDWVGLGLVTLMSIGWARLGNIDVHRLG